MPKNVLKICFDTAMLVLFLALFNLKLTGNLWHELLGLVLIALFAVHIAYNKNWVKGVFKRFGQKGMTKDKVMDIVNLLMAAGFLLVFSTGRRASHSLFQNATKAPDAVLKVHILVSLILLVLVLVHALLHLKMIKAVLNKLSMVAKIMLLTVLSAICIATIIPIGKVVVPKVLSSKSEQNGNHGQHGDKLDGSERPLHTT